ncbi:MAG: hypothetical protein PHV78_00720 [Patescibacteria group bacterium]|nr:hypothetical protein [Patescibacteria group bacterium]MDD5121309.1 hypothetical protein [Patescibacteria group bacterium]MDD5395772.1 hypothetical protein [Patescibacteria group bacterium]
MLVAALWALARGIAGATSRLDNSCLGSEVTIFALITAIVWMVAPNANEATPKGVAWTIIGTILPFAWVLAQTFFFRSQPFEVNRSLWASFIVAVIGYWLIFLGGTFALPEQKEQVAALSPP